MRMLSLLLLLFSFGCANEIAQEDLQNLNGYWEIEKVTFANGKTKEFKVSTTIDYIELNGLEGFRKKVQPKFNGTYETSNDAEPFMITTNNENFEIQYKNQKSAWREKLVQLKPDMFSVINEDSITYKYKRFHPINVSK